ncbi:hypothetical protein [Acerihabitans sp.]|uniref:hypothetical protein n=1 Tax=Acerihabitans sp. TaxID=2811394 RepID=UPI002ED86D54
MAYINAWFGRGMEHPWRTLALAQVMVGVYVALGALLIVRPGQVALEMLRQDIGRCKSAVIGLERAHAGLPARQRLEADTRRLRGSIAAGETLRRDPAAFIAVIHPGRAGKITWRTLGAAGDRERVSDRWQLAVTTDYPGLRRLLHNLCALEGARSLAELAVRRRDRLLEAELVLSAPAGAQTENERRENAPSKAGSGNPHATDGEVTGESQRAMAHGAGLAGVDK